MVIHIGQDYLLHNQYLVHVQDRDVINKIALIGIPDDNGIIFDTQWVDWKHLYSYPHNEEKMTNRNGPQEAT